MVNKKGGVVVFELLLLFVIMPYLVLAGDPYKPYLHKPIVPEHPDITILGTYETDLWPGAATFTYPIEIPPGTNDLQPTLFISYNHHSTVQRPSIIGAGWSLSENYIIRDIEYSFSNTSDDTFKLVLNGQFYDLTYNSSEGRYHTKIESYLYIKNESGGNNTNGRYWNVRDVDGTTYRFGYNGNSELVSNIHSYTTKWSLDLVTDTHGNNIYYSYRENPYANDTGAVYPDKIEYNNDKRRVVEFVLESSDRPDNWQIYEQGNKIRESRRVKGIQVKVDGNLVKKYLINYTLLDSKSFIESITLYGSDDTTNLPPVVFGYYLPKPGWYYDTNYLLPNPSVLKFEANKGDFGVRLEDLNRDGLIDIVKADGKNPSDNQSWINNGSGWIQNNSWNVPVFIVDNEQNDTGFRFLDFNGDGFTDIVLGDGSTRKSYTNTMTGWSSDNSTWHLPTNAQPVDSSQDIFERGVRFEDINGDGLPDILASTDQWNYAWINNKSGWQQDNSWLVPSGARFVNFATGKEEGVRIFDVNGDGLVDLVKGAQGDRRTWLNNGSNWIEDSSWQIPSGMEFINSQGEDEGVRQADSNGDGLIDLTKRKVGQTQQTWINTGKGWVRDDSWNVPTKANFVSQDGTNKAVRIVDVNGDGLIDLMNGEVTDLSTFINKKAIRAYLLKNITNNLGGMTTIDYGISTTIDNTGSDNISDMGFNLWVVGNAKEDNKMNGPHNLTSITHYFYEGGYYDYNSQEFRGFNKVDEIKPNMSIIRHQFHQDDALKGKEYKTEIFGYNSSVPFKALDFIWNKTGTNYYVVTLSEDIDQLYDESYENPKAIRTKYNYDQYGNVISTNYLGDNATQNDERYEYFEYAYNTSNWIVDKLKHYTLYGYDNTTKLRESFYRYDRLSYGSSPIKGDLTWEEDWLDIGSNPVIKYDYDSYGNLVNETDPNNYKTQYVYGIRDSTYTYADKVINPKGQVINYNFNLNTGNILSITDSNGYVVNYTYDLFGRIEKEILPYDTTTYPTKVYNYSFDGIPPEKIVISQRENNNTGETFDMYYFYDGLGNFIQSKEEANTSRQIIKNIYYDEDKRVKKISNPYFTTFNDSYSNPNSSIETLTYTYDPLSRITQIQNQDGTVKDITFDHWKITQNNENNNKETYYLDAYNQIIKIIEYNGNNYFTTQYSYNSSGDLISVKDSNNELILNYSYDSLGRKTTQGNINTGAWRYYYDNSSNLIKQTNAEGINVSLQYDELSRLMNKSSSNKTLIYNYDKVNGTLSSVSSSNFTINYSYDNRLRKTKEILIMGSKSLTKEWTYDSLDRIKTEKLPDNSIINYNYTAGLLISVSNVINNVEYGPLDNPTILIHSNNLQTNLTYDPKTFRLKEIKLVNKQDFDYVYDGLGNVVSINDEIKGLIENMSYDKLDQLNSSKKANSSTQFMFNYAYDNLGNILKISGLNNNISYFYKLSPRHTSAKITSSNELESVPSLITHCKTITYPNRVYYLGNNLSSSGTCLIIDANNVTIDGQGYQIVGNNVINSRGIEIVNQNDVIIKNVTIGNFDEGILYISNIAGSYVTILDVKSILNEGSGIQVHSGNGMHILYNINASNNGEEGIYLGNGLSIIAANLTNITANGNDNNGIRINKANAGPANFILTNITTNNNKFLNGVDINNADNTIIKNLISLNNDDYGLDISSSSNNIIQDGNISSVNLATSSVNNTFLNVTYNTESVPSGNELIRKWYFETQVNDSNGYLENATVTISNVSNSSVLSELTDVNGSIGKEELIEYINNSGVTTYNTPHTINTSKTGYITNITIYNLTQVHNVYHLVVLAAIPPILDVNSLTQLYSNNTLRVFGFFIQNLNSSTMSNISWNLNTGQSNITSNTNSTLTANQSKYVVVEYNYTSTGNYTVIASATSGSVSDSESIGVSV